MNRYSSLSDDFYVNMNLSTEMELPSGRESILQFFERLQKKYPTMRNFYCREKGDFILEEDKEQGHYRWSTIEARRLCSGHVNPERVDDALEQHKLVLELAPYMLSLSTIDCEAIDLLFGFDFTYRGNHNQLVAEALGLSPGLERAARRAGRHDRQLRADDHAGARRRVPHAVPAEHRDPHQRLSDSHRRVSRGAAERLRHRPPLRRPAPPTPPTSTCSTDSDQDLPRDGRPLRGRQASCARWPARSPRR